MPSDEGDEFYICGDSSFALVLVVAISCGLPFVVLSGLVRASPRGNWWQSWRWDINLRDGDYNDVVVAFKNLESLLQGHFGIAIVGRFGINGVKIVTACEINEHLF